MTSLASTVDPTGRLHVFGVIDGQLWHRMRHPDGFWYDWGPWGISATAVSAAAQADGKLHVAAIINGRVLHRVMYSEGAWTDFAPVTGLPAGSRVRAVTSAIDPSDNYQLAVVAADSGLADVYLRTRSPDGSWNGEWARLGTPEDVFVDITAIAAG